MKKKKFSTHKGSKDYKIFIATYSAHKYTHSLDL